jgi:sugar lactone lactonase YvrE
MRKKVLYSGLCMFICIWAIHTGNTCDVEDNGATLYMSDTYNHVIYTVDKISGAATVFAGKAGKSGSSDGKRTTTARFNGPNGIAHDSKNLFIADSNNHIIRTIDKATGMVSTLAGKAGESGSADGIGSAARFSSPNGIFCDGANLYVADTNNHTIRKIVISTGEVTTLAGTAGQIGSANGAGAMAKFNFPYSVWGDGKNLYAVDANNNTIRKIVIETGSVTTFAGKAGSLGDADDIGQAAEFYTPRGITGDGKNLYVADNQNDLIRKIDLVTGKVTTFAGISCQRGSIDGPGLTARFKDLDSLTCDAENLYVTETGQAIIRKINLTSAVVSTIHIKRR